MSVVLRPASQRLVGNVPVGNTGLHMTHFPITKSYLATAALAGRLEDEYGLADVRCRLISATLRDVHSSLRLGGASSSMYTGMVIVHASKLRQNGTLLPISPHAECQPPCCADRKRPLAYRF